MVNAGSVADQERVEVKRQQTAHALAQPRRIIHHFFAQKAKPPWGITDYGISHYEQLPLRPVESHFARGFSRHTYRDQRADLLAHQQFVVKFRSLAARVSSIVGMDCGSGSGARPQPVGCAHVVTVGEQDAADASLRQFMEILLGRLNRIDAEIPRPVGDQKTIEVVAMRLREPGPRENIVRDCPHGVLLLGLTLWSDGIAGPDRTPHATPTPNVCRRLCYSIRRPRRTTQFSLTAIPFLASSSIASRDLWRSPQPIPSRTAL